MSKKICSLLLLAVLLIASACTGKATPQLSAFFPKSGAISGWSAVDSIRTFTPQDLFGLVDGQADSFLAYGFEEVGVQKYQDGQDQTLNIEIWRLAAEDDAYGLFTMSRAGVPVDIGNQGDGDPGQRLIFWQDRYYVHVIAGQELPQDAIMTFGKAVSEALPQGGAQPALVSQLPQQDLEPGSEIYFHQETSIQSMVWLGGTNILGLGADTNGVIGRYAINGQAGYLLLVEYPTSERAATGLKALQSGTVSNLIASSSHENTVGAVFGKIDLKSALQLLDGGLVQ